MPRTRLAFRSVLEECRIGYRTIGELDEGRSNAVLVPSWYGGNTAAWVELQGALLGEDHSYFVILVDALGNRRVGFAVEQHCAAGYGLSGHHDPGHGP